MSEMQQTPSSNVKVISAAYEALARGDLDAALSNFSDGIVWSVAEGHPLAGGNPYVGLESVKRDMLTPLAADWDGLQIKVEEILDAGHKVLVQGRYLGLHKETGRRLDAQMAHIFTFENGKVVHYQQYVDTAQVNRVQVP